MVLIERLDDPAARLWHAAAEDGWSRNGLINMSINTSMERSGGGAVELQPTTPLPLFGAGATGR